MKSAELATGLAELAEEAHGRAEAAAIDLELSHQNTVDAIKEYGGGVPWYPAKWLENMRRAAEAARSEANRLAQLSEAACAAARTS